MAIKERLLKQLQIVRDGLNAMPPFHSRDLNATRNALVQARDLCFQGLSENRFAEYKDTYDGLLLAVDQLAAGAPDQGEIASLCSELLQHTITQTLKETAFKKEIFFLPYKASMWDSLESVWKAADEDVEHCIAYVMPIPYADLTPEHTVAEWHCERELFPENVPTLDWQTINLEEMHPDVIFIHNPYDQYNRVTSVESRYYSSKLKACTDKLVYIPYFVLGNIISGDEALEESISNFILTPAVLNADEVIVQSEDMRQVYINVLVRNTNQKDHAYWEKRILGLGSPKIEKVLTSKKENFELPAAWAKIVKGKKVILYNTSLNAMLQNSDKVCEKLRYVFEIFKNRHDVALWWRPHPLMKATIHSMRPEIEKEYCQIEHQYVKEGWGIYDDTEDIHRAIAWSDAYYGDASSVVYLYRATRKPAMIENMSQYHEGNFALYFQNFTIADNKLWAISSGSFIGLFEMDLPTGEIKCLGELPTEYNRFLNWLVEYSLLEKVGNKIIIAPFFSLGNFIEFDAVERDFRILSLQHISQSGIYVRFNNKARWNESIYFIGNGTGIATEYKIDSGEIIYHHICVSNSQDLTKPLFIEHGVQVEKYLYMTVSKSNRIWRLDLETFEVFIYTIPYDFKGGIILFDGSWFWVLSDPRDCAVKCNFENNEYELLDGKTLIMGKYRCIDDFKDSLMIWSVGDRLFLLRSNRKLEIYNYKTKNVCIYTQHANKEKEREYRRVSRLWTKLESATEAEDLDLLVFLSIKPETSVIKHNYAIGAGRRTINNILTD